jgi:molecular chaperone HscA
MQARALREARVDAERLILAIRSALAADGDLLSEQERSLIDRRVEELAQAGRGEDAAAIQASTEALSDSTEAFAAARMNRGIRAALTGRRVEEV